MTGGRGPPVGGHQSGPILWADQRAVAVRLAGPVTGKESLRRLLDPAGQFARVQATDGVLDHDQPRRHATRLRLSQDQGTEDIGDDQVAPDPALFQLDGIMETP